LDVSSLSGGERALVALSLIFAIQDYKPYHFYVFDEIDASLDKRNSERLANLIKENIRKAQYIIISHNDSVINEGNTIYGVSMQEGVSKVVGLKI
jgi:chromosome segregation protein